MVKRRLYVTNLAADASAEELQQLFDRAGEVTGVHILRDAETGLSRGLAFVDMASDGAAENAIAVLNESRFHNHVLNVSYARQLAAGLSESSRRRGNRRW
jgi:RNA recognition motif-containing protein